ncbi:hypothetical protein AKO1_012619 [Acrasis kona]|uniref:BCAS3 WD40 domain-containing protein n=1 Tax=Acrasis kona TaxID=1008807 RepID=A0AAW2YVN3_9EUKA
MHHVDPSDPSENAQRQVQLGAVALGQRWIAYPSINMVTNKNMDYTQQSNQTIAEISMDVAKNIASATLYLGDIGYKQLSSVISGQQHSHPASSSSSHNQSKTHLKEAGTIEIRDIQTKQLICHFKAHPEPIAAMAFDPSGTLLVTVSIKGTNLNVYQIMPNTNGKVTSKNIKHIYRLLRGVTSASIHDIRFSINSKWIAVCSNHGTTHLFALNPNGGKIKPIEFVSTLYDSQLKLSHSQDDDIYHHHHHHSSIHDFHDSFNEPPITLNAVKKIHGASCVFYNEREPLLESECDEFQSIVRKSFENLFICTRNGWYCHYRLEPIVREEQPTTTSKLVNHVIPKSSSQSSPNVNQSSSLDMILNLNVSLIFKMEACRAQNQTSRDLFLDWNDYQNEQDFKIYPVQHQDGIENDDLKWSSNAEIETYQLPSMPLWMTGQFKFKTFSMIHDQDESYKNIDENVNHFENHDPFENSKLINQVNKNETINTNASSKNDMMSKSVMIRITDPIPLRNHSDDDDDDDSDHEEYEKKRRDEEKKSMVVHDGSIMRAMSTPMHNSKQSLPSFQKPNGTNHKSNRSNQQDDNNRSKHEWDLVTDATPNVQSRRLIPPKEKMTSSIPTTTNMITSKNNQQEEIDDDDDSNKQVEIDTESDNDSLEEQVVATINHGQRQSILSLIDVKQDYYKSSSSPPTTITTTVETINENDDELDDYFSTIQINHDDLLKKKPTDLISQRTSSIINTTSLSASLPMSKINVATPRLSSTNDDQLKNNILSPEFDFDSDDDDDDLNHHHRKAVDNKTNDGDSKLSNSILSANLNYLNDDDDAVMNDSYLNRLQDNIAKLQKIDHGGSSSHLNQSSLLSNSFTANYNYMDD